MRHRILATLFALSAALPAHAGTLLNLSIVDRDTGQVLPTYAADGQLYVAGVPGHRYSVRMVNRTGGRLLTVLSVDGVNAVNGATASTDQTGYVLDAYASADITGWRKSLDEIAQFNFTALPNSYAARTGRPGNVGVIGVAVFTERLPVWRERELLIQRKAEAQSRGTAADAAPAPAPPSAEAESAAARTAAAPAMRQESLGTGHGQREYSHVDHTQFERAQSTPVEVLTIRYDSQANLIAQGVIPRPVAPRHPQPFSDHYVPDPPLR